MLQGHCNANSGKDRRPLGQARSGSRRMAAAGSVLPNRSAQNNSAGLDLGLEVFGLEALSTGQPNLRCAPSTVMAKEAASSPVNASGITKYLRREPNS